MMKANDELGNGEYKYGFHDKDVSIYKTEKGINRAIVEEISKIKNEPQWMLDFRLKAYDAFIKMPIQDWGPNLDQLDFNEYTYYIRPSSGQENDWDEVPDTIKNTFDRLGIPEAEAK
ncbi:MAG: Fe-S cluster assembly protein SufB, partial [Erysipelotrichaceae bacterium]